MLILYKQIHLIVVEFLGLTCEMKACNICLRIPGKT
jgi:hypothetical protein